MTDTKEPGTRVDNPNGKPCPRCGATGALFLILYVRSTTYENCWRCRYSKGHAPAKYRMSGSLLHAIRRMLGGK